jgi:hypothetical protein
MEHDAWLTDNGLDIDRTAHKGAKYSPGLSERRPRVRQIARRALPDYIRGMDAK